MEPQRKSVLRRVARLLCCSPLVLFLSALLARLGNIHIRQILHGGGPDHLAFGYEVGRIARSLVEGQGFSSPFLYASGPTAWLGPVYPLLLAGCFKVFGVYSPTAATAILCLNSLFAAFTCVVVFLIGRETLGEAAGLSAAWFLAVAPFEINFATRLIWDTSLSALLLSIAFLVTLRIEHCVRNRAWIAYGLLWGFVALTNPSLLSFLPVAVFWLCYRRSKGQRLRWLAALAAFVITLAPWTVRNYHALHKFVPLRDNLAMELYLGNHEGADGFVMAWDHPVWNDREMTQYARQGEVRYLAGKMQIFRDFASAQPARFVELTLKRVLIFWAGVPQMGRIGPGLGMKARHALYFLSSFMTIWGLLLVIRHGQRGAFLFAGTVALYPLVYYVTHNNARYRHPIEPVMALLVGYLVQSALDQARSGKSRASSLEPVLATSTLNTGRSA